jgi:hypothetical protein
MVGVTIIRIGLFMMDTSIDHDVYDKGDLD